MAAAPTPEPVSGIRKAAILLISLGDHASAEILRQLSDEEVQKVSLEVARIEAVEPGQAQSVLEEFHQKIGTSASFGRGGTQYVRKMLVSALGAEPAEKVLAQVSQVLGKEDGALSALQKADPQQLANFIQNEHPQTIALILSNLSPAQAGPLLLSLPATVRPEVAARIANLDQIAPEVLNRIVEVVSQKLHAVVPIRRRQSGGLRALADLLNQIDAGVSEEILTGIGQNDATLLESIRGAMFVFEDVLTIDKEGMKALIGKVDRKILTMALKGTSEALKNHFTQVMSQRGTEMLREDMEALGPVRIRDVEAAQRQIIAVIKQLQSEGSLSMGASAADNQYVV